MKSRISSADLFKKMFTAQIWVPIAAFLTFFLTGPVLQLMIMSSWDPVRSGRSIAYYQELFQRNVAGRVSEGNGMILFMCAMMFFAAVTAWTGFCFLHSRSQTDFYHALPVKRSGLFGILTGIACLNYVLSISPALLLVGVCGAAKGVLGLETVRGLFFMFLSGFVFFMLCFFLSAMAMLLTGRILVGILGTMVFYVGGLLLKVLLAIYASEFFLTIYQQSRTQILLDRPYGSPLFMTMLGMSDAAQGEWKITALGLLAALLYGLADLLLCCIRPSEAAETPMAFYVPGEIIKIALVTIASLTAGLVFHSFSDQGEGYGWLLFGLVFGAVVFYAIIQMIYYHDIRRAFGNIPALILSAALPLLITGIYVLDLTGYDTRLAPENRIESVGLSMDQSGNYYRHDKWTVREKILKDMRLPCTEDVYAYLTALTQAQGKARGSGKFEDETELTGQTVHVRLKNGSDYWRQYQIPFEDVQDACLKLHDNPEFLDRLFLIRLLEPEEITHIAVRNTRYTVFVPEGGEISEDDWEIEEWEEEAVGVKNREALAAALKADLSEISSKTLTEEIPVAQIGYSFGTELFERVGLQETDETVSGMSTEYLNVYPSFHRTLEELNKQHISTECIPETAKLKEIRVISNEDGKLFVYTDPGKMKEIQSRFISYSDKTPWHRVEKDSVQIVWEDEDDMDYCLWGNLEMTSEINVLPEADGETGA